MVAGLVKAAGDRYYRDKIWKSQIEVGSDKEFLEVGRMVAD